MNLEKKLEIVDNYVKGIKQYLHYGLEEGRANGSEGEDLMEHFKIMAESFKKVVQLEDKLGIDLDTLSKALKNGFYYKQNFHNVKTGKWEQLIKYTDYCYLYYDGDNNDGAGAYFLATIDRQFYIKDYGKKELPNGWALTKEELE